MGILDIVTTPTYSDIIPSTKKAITYRPFLVVEERALLVAQESEDMATMVNTISAVVKACISPKSAVERLTSFDIEYLFVRIRMKSIGEESSIIITCPACSTPTPITIPLDKVEIYSPPDHKNTIKLSASLAVKMKYLSLEEMTSLMSDESTDIDGKMKLIAMSIDTVYDNETQYYAAEETKETMMSFIKKFTSVQYEKLVEFFDTMPETRLTFDWSCPKCKANHNKTLRGLNNFF